MRVTTSRRVGADLPPTHRRTRLVDLAINLAPLVRRRRREQLALLLICRALVGCAQRDVTDHPRGAAPRGTIPRGTVGARGELLLLSAVQEDGSDHERDAEIESRRDLEVEEHSRADAADDDRARLTRGGGLVGTRGGWRGPVRDRG